MSTFGHGEADSAASMCAVTVSRQYGSGGGEVAARLASALGWRMVDHEAVARVAHELGLSAEDAEARDERVASFVEEALHSMALAYPIGAEAPGISPHARDQAYHEALHRVILAAAAEGNVVLVGRGAHLALADRRDVLRVGVVAPLERRVIYTMRREGLDEREARERIQRKDQDRARYVQTHYGAKPWQPGQYDLIIDTGVLTLDDAVALIRLALDRKAARLGVPEDRLGPGSEVAPYPTRPSDAPLPQADQRP